MKRQTFLNESAYRHAIARLPAPPPEESLASRHPELVKDWDWAANAPLTPDLYTEGSRQLAYWRCSKCGHRWRAMIGSRAKGRGCPPCAFARRGELKRQKSIREYGTVADQPEMIRLWLFKKNKKIGLDPTRISPQTRTRAWWRCTAGHLWCAEIRNVYRGTRCRTCYLLQRQSSKGSAKSQRRPTKLRREQ